MTADQLKIFYNALHDEPLEPDHPYYVPYLVNEDGGGDPIAELATQITWSEVESVNLLSGQRGNGKSTELRRLRRMLEDQGCAVFYSDMREYMNMTTPVDITDFFISIMTALNEEVNNRFHNRPLEEGYWERLVKFLNTDVKMDEISLKGGPVEVKASLKDDPTFRKKLQDNLKGHVARMVRDAHEFASSVTDLVRRNGKPDTKVVFLIDSVEQIRGVGADSDSVYKSVENLFSAHAESLRLPSLHVVYTIPPYLMPLSPGIGSRLGGGAVFTLPSVHVFNYKSNEPNEHGMNIMQKIIEKRFSDWQEVFTSDQVRNMALNTGGDLREFFRLVRSCLVKTSTSKPLTLPVEQRIIEEAENHLRREMLPIAEDDMKWLRQIKKTKTSKLESISKLQGLARFFDTKLVLNYRNGEDWYDIHPLLHESINNSTEDE
jgi:hypothetical protein